jgi:hypothetical protein
MMHPDRYFGPRSQAPARHAWPPKPMRLEGGCLLYPFAQPGRFAKGVGMARYVGQTFEDSDILVDGKHYERCTFRRCRLTFSASAPQAGAFLSNRFEECTWVIDGAATETLSFLSVLCQIGWRAEVENILRQVLSGEFTRRPERGPVTFQA